jgi:hypothetical protein
MTREEIQIGDLVKYNENDAKVVAFGSGGTVTIQFLNPGGHLGHDGLTHSEWRTKEGVNIYEKRDPNGKYYYINPAYLTKVASTRKRICKYAVGAIVTCRVSDKEDASGSVTYRGVVVGIRSCGTRFTLKLTHCSGVPSKLTKVSYFCNAYGERIQPDEDIKELYKDFDVGQTLDPNNSLPLPPLKKEVQDSPSVQFDSPGFPRSEARGFVLGQYVTHYNDVFEIVGFDLNRQIAKIYSPTLNNWDGTNNGCNYTDHFGRPIYFRSKGNRYFALSLESLSPSLNGFYSHDIQENANCKFLSTKVTYQDCRMQDRPLPKYVTSEFFTFPTKVPSNPTHTWAAAADHLARLQAEQEAERRFLSEHRSNVPQELGISQEYLGIDERRRRQALHSSAEIYMKRAAELGYVPIDMSGRQSRPDYIPTQFGTSGELMRGSLEELFQNPSKPTEEKSTIISLTPNKKQKTLPKLEEVPTFTLNFKPFSKPSKHIS